MTEHEKRIREALEAGPTEGPWFEHHHKGRLYIENQRDDVVCDMGLRVKSNPTSQFIAACNPSAIRALLADLDAMRADARRYAAFFTSGLPVCFEGQEYYSKADCDADIDATLKGASA